MDPTVRLISNHFSPKRGHAWHGGPTPSGALAGVTAQMARWRPAPGRHSIWELALHAAYWNHMVRRRLLGGAASRFPRGPANWPAVPAPADEAAWARDRALLADQHRLMAETIERFPAARVTRGVGGKKRWTGGDLLLGVAMHDAYHAGQIQMVKRLWQAR